MIRLHCWILIGPANVRKGSVVRSLTGVGSGRDATVKLVNGQWLFLHYATIKSVNEGLAPDPNEWVQRQIVDVTRVSTAKGSFVNFRGNLLLSFRMNIGGGRDPEDYVKALLNVGAVIESIVTLGTDTPVWAPAVGAPYASIPDSGKAPTNATAHYIRAFWGWL